VVEILGWSRVQVEEVSRALRRGFGLGSGMSVGFGGERGVTEILSVFYLKLID
jgi:hypothetical protein